MLTKYPPALGGTFRLTICESVFVERMISMPRGENVSSL
jgi:hypothetical protein